MKSFELFVSFRPEAQKHQEKKCIRIESITLTIMESVDKFAPETLCKDKAYGTEWITTNIKNAISELNKNYKNRSTILRMKTDQQTNWQKTV